jgi:hypothetical protein
MPSVFAIVSKAMFEKMVDDAELGTIVSVDRYVSKNKAFDDVGAGDAIFMHTVRPPKEHLWLVAIIESPKKSGDNFVGKANTTPITDITAAVKKLKLASGTGIKAKKGALGMSLQTPRVLTADDVKLLRGLVPAPKKGKAPAKKVSAREAYNTAVAEAVAEGKPSKKGKAGKVKLGNLRWENRREPFKGTYAKLDEVTKKQLAKLPMESGTVEEVFSADPDDEAGWFQATELIDVVDNASGEVLYNLYLYPFGDGSMFDAGTTKEAGAVCQHGYEDTVGKGPLFIRDMALAYTEAKKRLKINEMISWSAEELAGDDEDDD